ncbi:unnamed protein product [Phyllotreta striolata]|uniref:Uncharacterized protein n=1 Tax=Phyllotreta striolata TaxID=444603 RepID=A0A9N9TIM6_PHYSR|nr:unnamed protein product [Phyllotreta striolata]
MHRVLLLCAFVATAATSYLPQTELTVLDPYSGISWNGPSISGIGAYAGTFQTDGVLQKGSQLTSIARTSAASAKNAVYNQNSAGSQAEYGVKSNLANVAVGAARAAQAALTGKQAIYSNLKHQLIAAQGQLKEEIAQYHQAKVAAQTAQEAAHKAQAQVATQRTALIEAENTAHNTAAAAAEAGNAEAAQKEMVLDAKQRVENLLRQLKIVAGDLKEIEYSANKANNAANVAKLNAANSGLKNDYLGSQNLGFNNYH